MSASRRKSTRSRRNDEPEPVDDDLPTLEPIEDDDAEFDVLEPIDAEDDAPASSPVRVNLETVEEDDYDLRLRVTLPAEAERQAIPELIAEPLRRAVDRHAAELRWQRVQVVIAGDEIAPSKTKELVADLLGPVKPVFAAVQRGYPDETVLENEPPSADVDVDAIDGDPERLRVVVDSGPLAAVDLPVALRGDLDGLVAQAAGKSIAFTFRGSARPAPRLVEDLRSRLASAGAVRATLRPAADADEELLFDRELEGCVEVSESSRDDCDTELVVTPPGDDDDVTRRAFAMVLPAAQTLITAKRIRARFAGREPLPGELEALQQQLLELKLGRLELERDDDVDVLLPKLLRTASKGERTMLGVVLGGRDRAATLAAFRREVTGLGEIIAGKRVTVDWPEEFPLDADVERACAHEALAPIGPAAVSFAVRGEHAWPILPVPLELRRERDGFGELLVGRLDTDAGKPVELARAIDRRLQQEASRLAGQRVRIEVVGDGAVSRTMRRTLREWLEHAGVRSAEFIEREVVDVWLPRMLQVGSGAGGPRLSVDPAWRDAAQIELALQREIEDVDVSGGTVTLDDSPATEAVITALVDRGAERVMLADDSSTVQVHPPLFATPSRDGAELVITATPDAAADDDLLRAQLDREWPALLAAQGGNLADTTVTVRWPGATRPFTGALQATLDRARDAGCAVLRVDAGGGRTVQVFPEVVREPVHILGRKDDATPPMKLLGIDWSDDPLDAEALAKQLTGMRADLEGHRVLAVFQAPPGSDLELPDSDPLVVTLVGALESVAAAILLFRTGAGAPHFQVVTSQIEGLAIGDRFRDPRGGPR